jgi:hypothetical protein
MGKRSLMCVLLGTLAWGQAQPSAAPPAHPGNTAAPQVSAMRAAAPPDTSDSVAMNAPVLTIQGVCKPQPKPAAAKAGAAPAKPAAKTTPTACKTVITRAEFEKLESYISPKASPQLKRQLQSSYPSALAFAQAAHQQGLDKGERFEALMKLQRIQLLSSELRRKINDDATNLSDTDVDEYYQKNLASYQQFNLDRVFVPHFRQPEAEAKPDLKDEAKEKDEKSADKKETKAEEEEARKARTEQAEAKLADDLRTRAVAGEDFTKLQKEAYDAAGMKLDVPNINLPKVRRNALPPGQASVFELKEGEVSQVISDSGGHYIYRVKAIEQMPLDDTLKNEIKGMLTGQKQRAGMEKYQNSYTVESNEAYFGPPAPAGRPGAPPMRMPPNMKMPPAAQTPAHPQAPAPTQPPAAPPN